MSSITNQLLLRPRFKLIIPKRNTDEVLKVLRECYDKNCYPLQARFVQDHIHFLLKGIERKFWSPEMNLQVMAHEKGTFIRGIIAPNGQIWVLLMFAYGALSIIALFILMYGLTQISLKMDAPILLVLPMIALIAFVIYLTARSGKKIASAQINIYHDYLDASLKDFEHEWVD